MAFQQQMRHIFDRYAMVFGRTLLWMGGGLMLMALGFWLHSWNATRPLLNATGTVTDNAASFAPAGGVLYFPRIRFRASNGQLMQVLTKEGSEEAEFMPGETLPVLYAANDPQDAIIATRWRIYKTADLLGITGVILFDGGLLLGYGRSWLRRSGRTASS